VDKRKPHIYRAEDYGLDRERAADGTAAIARTRRSPDVSERLRRGDDRRMAYLRTLFRQISIDENDAEARSFLVLSLFVGNSLITAEHDGRSRREVIDHALESLLSPSRQP
jgi:hypothetical protein